MRCARPPTAPPVEGELSARALWLQESAKVGAVLEQIPAAKHRRALQSFKEANPERWPDALLASLNHVSAKLAGEVAHALISGGKLDGLKELLARLISQHQASSELLLWLAKERSDSFADILGPEVFRAMLTAMERDQFNEKRSNKLRDFILADQTLLVELIGSADLEVIKDLTRALQLSPCFDDMDKRSLLARIVKSYPAVQTMISGDQTKQEDRFSSFPGKAWSGAKMNTPNWCKKPSRPIPGKLPWPAAMATCAKTTNTKPPRKCKKSSCAAKANWRPNWFAPAAAILPIPAPMSPALGHGSR